MFDWFYKLKKWIYNLFKPKWNDTQVFNHGYVVGYNQALVDKGFLNQNQADVVASKFNEERKKGIWITGRF